MKKFWSLTIVLCLLLAGPNVFAMSSTNYWIPWDTVNSGGDDVGTSTNFSIHDSIGGNVVGTSTSANYTLSQGYRVPEEANTLSYIVKSGSALTAYGAFSNGVGGTVTVSSTAGFAVDDLIAVVENTGFSELVAVGIITDITGSTITVDQFEGDGASMSTVPNGVGDNVYRLPSNNLSLGVTTVGAEQTSVVGTSVLTNVSTGYSIYIQANQRLTNESTGQPMADVADGAVSAGYEEYGAEVTGATASGAGSDFGIAVTQRVIQTSAAASGTISDKVAMIYKLSVTGATVPGAYSQTVYYTLTANY